MNSVLSKLENNHIDHLYRKNRVKSISFLIVLVNALLAYAILRRPMRPLCIGLAFLCIVSNLSLGLLARPQESTEKKTVKVAAIQGNINSHDKWNASTLYKTKQIYRELTERAAAEGAELVVWPESVLPYDLNYRTDLKNFLSCAHSCLRGN